MSTHGLLLSGVTLVAASRLVGMRCGIHCMSSPVHAPDVTGGWSSKPDKSQSMLQDVLVAV